MAPPSSPDLSLFNSTSELLSFLDLNDQQMQNTENMDIDLLTVPDTPERLSGQKINIGENSVDEVQTSSVGRNSGISNILDKRIHNFESINNRRLFSCSRVDTGINLGHTQHSTHPAVVNLVDSPPVIMNPCAYRKTMSNKASLPTGSVVAGNDRAKLDRDTLTIAEFLADNDRRRFLNKEKMSSSISISKVPGNAAFDIGKSPRKKCLLQGNDEVCGSAVVGKVCGKETCLPSDAKVNTEQVMPRSFQAGTLPRKNGQRKLVRNGCISPLNIAKAKSATERHATSSKDGRQDSVNGVFNLGATSSDIHIVSPLSGGIQTDRMKGKGVMAEFSAQSLHSSSRSLLTPTVEDDRNEDGSQDVMNTTTEGRGGWRSTRNPSNNISFTVSDGVRHLSRTNEGVGRSHEISGPASLQHGPTPLSDHPSSDVRSELDSESEQHCGTSKIARKQRKRGSNFGSNGECSTSVFDDSEIAFLWSPEEPSNARSTRSRTSRRRGNLHPIIEIDDTSPDLHRGNPQNTTQMVNDDSAARARQMEADELLARELQEQLYDELPVVGDGEVDADIAWALQHEDEVQHAASLRRQRVHPRDASMSHLYRQRQTQALQNSLIRSAARANRGCGRAPTSARGRLRDRFFGSSRTISGETNVPFHPNMNVGIRMRILEAQGDAERDFNENDYEMLLALDEDNHRHVGATSVQINGLPQSIVQTENFAEPCAVCLETPTVGDTIRHLPCLHKFHKECIDPWLRRKTSCPICKSGIT